MKTNPKETGVLFNAPMVRAINGDYKTNTRRIMKVQPTAITPAGRPLFHDDNGRRISPKPPYGGVGDLIWVRETTKADHETADTCTLSKYAIDSKPVLRFDERINQEAIEHWWYSKDVCPSIHMPKWACRTWLEITDVKVERLQDISADNAISEGIEGLNQPTGDDYQDYWRNYIAKENDDWQWPWFAGDPIASFKSLWVSIYGKENWDANPWVFATSFKKINKTT